MNDPAFAEAGKSRDYYNYIITGAGCAGLSLLMHMIRSGKFGDKKILLVDREVKDKNDRTWCFWETAPGLFEPIVYHRWPKAWFRADDFSRLLTLAPYEYKLVRGIDFYTYCLDSIRRQPNIDIRTGEVQQLTGSGNETSVTINGQVIRADYVFNSVLPEKPVLKKNDHYLLQHFRGWTIETTDPVFDPSEATLMDFRTDQQHGTTFVYVMPFTSRKALVEYTLFTSQLLADEQYDMALDKYIREVLGTASYKVAETESGVIPMTTYKFPASTGNIIHLGTAGGQTKASSGYTFQFIQKHAAAIVKALLNGKFPVAGQAPKRFRFYDNTLLHILANGVLPGHTIFTTLFKKNNPQQVLRFLDNESSLGEELKIISSLPVKPFLKAAIRQW